MGYRGLVIGGGMLLLAGCGAAPAAAPLPTAMNEPATQPDPHAKQTEAILAQINDTIAELAVRSRAPDNLPLRRFGLYRFTNSDGRSVYAHCGEVATSHSAEHFERFFLLNETSEPLFADTEPNFGLFWARYCSVRVGDA
jgi:hypothetical protein